MPNEETGTDVTTGVQQDTSTVDSSTTENNSTEVADSTSSYDQNEGFEDDSRSTDDYFAEEDEEDNQPRRGADARKEQLSESIEQQKEALGIDPSVEIRDLVAANNALKEVVAQQTAQYYQPASVDELLQQENPETGEYYNRLEAQLESMRQEREVEKYNNAVSQSLSTIENDSQRALRDFPEFNPDSPEFNPELAGTVAEIVQQSLVTDQQSGQLIGTRVPIYQLYKSYAVAAKTSAKRAEMQGQRKAQQMMSSADHVSGGTGSSQKSFEKMSLSEQEAYLRKKGHDV